MALGVVLVPALELYTVLPTRHCSVSKCLHWHARCELYEAAWLHGADRLRHLCVQVQTATHTVTHPFAHTRTHPFTCTVTHPLTTIITQPLAQTYSHSHLHNHKLVLLTEYNHVLAQLGSAQFETLVREMLGMGEAVLEALEQDLQPATTTEIKQPAAAPIAHTWRPQEAPTDRYQQMIAR